MSNKKEKGEINYSISTQLNTMQSNNSIKLSYLLIGKFIIHYVKKQGTKSMHSMISLLYNNYNKFAEYINE